MNNVVLCGRLTRDPEIRNANGMTVARYSLAVDRRVKRDANDPNQQTADFIPCIAFGRGAEFVEKWLHKGSQILVRGHIQTGRYTNREGQTVYTTDVVAEDHEFVGKRDDSASAATAPVATQEATADFVKVPDGAEEVTGLPFD